MELKDVLQQMIQTNVQSGQPTDLCIGTVVNTSPLQITINTGMAPLEAAVLYLTAAVVEKKIPILQHSHTVTVTQGSATCATALPPGSTTVLENGEALPVENGYIILNRALETGDIVLLLKVQKGQKFIVLSRVFAAGGGA